jgi:uncharacterized protein YkwD
MIRSSFVFLCLGLCFASRAGEPAKFEMTKEEQKLVELTNAERKKKDLPVLKPSPLLIKVARAHSANMAKQGKMAHELDGKNPFQRLKEAGYTYFFAGENVAAGLDELDEVMKGWMESEPHRKNILSEKFTEIGVGVARDKKGEPYFTQVFGKPR